MASPRLGDLQITTLRNPAVAEELAQLLAEAEGSEPEDVLETLSRLPLLLRSGIPEAQAKEMMEFFAELGVECTFTPTARNAAPTARVRPAPSRGGTATRQIFMPLLLFLAALTLAVFVLLRQP